MTNHDTFTDPEGTLVIRHGVHLIRELIAETKRGGRVHLFVRKDGEPPAPTKDRTDLPSMALRSTTARRHVTLRHIWVLDVDEFVLLPDGTETVQVSGPCRVSRECRVGAGVVPNTDTVTHHVYPVSHPSLWLLLQDHLTNTWYRADGPIKGENAACEYDRDDTVDVFGYAAHADRCCSSTARFTAEEATARARRARRVQGR
jgi:hypothetical protein